MVNPVELIMNKSAQSSVNGSKENRNSRIEAKILLSANRLSSKKCSSSNKENYMSEAYSSKEIQSIPQVSQPSTPINRILHRDSCMKQYLLNASSNDSLNINKSELELISSNDYKDEAVCQFVDLVLKNSEPSSETKNTQNG